MFNVNHLYQVYHWPLDEVLSQIPFYLDCRNKSRPIHTHLVICEQLDVKRHRLCTKNQPKATNVGRIPFNRLFGILQINTLP